MDIEKCNTLKRPEEHTDFEFVKVPETQQITLIALDMCLCI